jgi:hypothetical protein
LLLIITTIKSAYTANGIVMRYVEWLLAGSGSRCCQQPVNIMHDYAICCLYPDDEQQACSKHIEAFIEQKLI